MLASEDFRKGVRGVREVTPVAESKIPAGSTAWYELKNGAIKYKVASGVCFVYFNLAISLSTSHAWVTDMPSGFRPPYPVYTRLSGGNGNGWVNVAISNTGGISAWVDSGTNTAINGWILYPIS